MKFIIGKKLGMTQVFNETGRVEAATVIKAEPLTVTQVKTSETDGYSALQLAYGETTDKHINKAQQGHYKDLGKFEGAAEYRSESEPEAKVGDKVDLSVFETGDVVNVSGVSKGKGFQGGVKRHGFAGGPRSHGQKHSEREVGSIGATGPQRVFKGTRMPGRMGGDRVTVKNLKVLKVDQDKGELLVSGAVPGKRGTLLEVRA